MSSLFWYVHDQGRGHLDRARAVIAELQIPVVVAAGPGIADQAATCLDVPVIALPVDHEGAGATPRCPWHHAPPGRTLRARGAAIAEGLQQYDCTTAVVDVSAEVTAMASLFGLRTVTLRQSGRRDDPTHRLGWSCADVVWVPQHPSLEPIDEPIDERWFFSGAFSRFDRVPRPRVVRSATVVLLVGRGGTALSADRWRWATAPDGWQVLIAGLDARWEHGGVRSLGFVDDVLPLLCSAQVVVTSAGWSSVADIVVGGARPALVAEHRPFDEQARRAEALAAAGLAVRLDRWPTPDDLPTVIASAMKLDPSTWTRFHDGRGAVRAARMIEEVHAR